MAPSKNDLERVFAPNWPETAGAATAVSVTGMPAASNSSGVSLPLPVISVVLAGELVFNTGRIPSQLDGWTDLGALRLDELLRTSSVVGGSVFEGFAYSAAVSLLLA